MNENCLSVGIICTPAGIGHGEHIFNLNYLISAKSAALPASGSSVRIEMLIPWSLVKRGVRREVIMPINAPAVFLEGVRQERKQHSPLLRYLGLAHYWQQLLDNGKFRSITEIAAAEGMDVGQVSRMIRLTQLSPASASAIVAGTSEGITLRIAIRCSIPLEWHLQRAADLDSCR